MSNDINYYVWGVITRTSANQKGDIINPLRAIFSERT